MSSNGIFSLLQFAYRKNHSTESALLEEKNDLLIINIIKGHVSLLVLLDLSAVFDTVDPEILMHILQTEFGLGGAVLSWFVSYVNHRSQRVSHGVFFFEFHPLLQWDTASATLGLG